MHTSSIQEHQTASFLISEMDADMSVVPGMDTSCLEMTCKLLSMANVGSSF